MRGPPVESIYDLYFVSPDYRRFNQKFDIFSRSTWDPDVRSLRSEELPSLISRRIEEMEEGFRLEDCALMQGLGL